MILVGLIFSSFLFVACDSSGNQSISTCIDKLINQEDYEGSGCTEAERMELMEDYALNAIEGLDYGDSEINQLLFYDYSNYGQGIGVGFQLINVPYIEGEQTYVLLEDFINDIIDDLQSKSTQELIVYVSIHFTNGETISITKQVEGKSIELGIKSTEDFEVIFPVHSTWILAKLQEDFYSFKCTIEDTKYITYVDFHKEELLYSVYIETLEEPIQYDLEIDSIITVVENILSEAGYSRLTPIT